MNASILMKLPGITGIANPAVAVPVDMTSVVPETCVPRKTLNVSDGLPVAPAPNGLATAAIVVAPNAVIHDGLDAARDPLNTSAVAWANVARLPGGPAWRNSAIPFWRRNP